MKLTEPQKQLEKQVRKEFPNLVKGMAGDKKAELLRLLETRIPALGREVVITQTQMTSSPVPPAELLMGYNSAITDGANRLFTLVENQSAHRQTVESRVINGQILSSRIGQIMAFVLALVFGYLGYKLTMSDHPNVGGTVFGTTVLGLVSIFVAGQKNQKRNLDEKAPK